MKQTIFVEDEQALEKKLCSLKQNRCPGCRRRGTLNRHDKLQGHRPDHATDRHQRGQRAWCSNRGKRGGCGRTVTLIFQWVLPRHSFTAGLLGSLLQGLGRGLSRSQACARLRTHLSEEGALHLLHRFRRRLSAVRSALVRRCPPPPCRHRDPLIQTIQHLQCAFPTASCSVAAFQMAFQRPIMG